MSLSVDKVIRISFDIEYNANMAEDVIEQIKDMVVDKGRWCERFAHPQNIRAEVIEQLV